MHAVIDFKALNKKPQVVQWLTLLFVECKVTGSSPMRDNFLKFVNFCMNSVCHVGNPVGNDMAFTRLGGASMVGYYIVVDCLFIVVMDE